MTLVMGILNVTPDSFSDGGRWVDAGSAVRRGLEMVEQGAAVIDVGGESTRPGAERVEEAEELRRVVPVVEALAARDVTVSVDTMRASVARACLASGARIINDVSGGRADPGMFDAVAGTDADLVLMHWRAHSSTMQDLTTYDELLGDVIGELLDQRDQAVSTGIDAHRIILDPGIGFSKSFDQNWDLLRALPRFQELGHRVLVGVSRKGFLGEVLGGRPPLERDAATAAVSAHCAALGIWAVRTHEVPMQCDAVRVGQRLAG